MAKVPDIQVVIHVHYEYPGEDVYTPTDAATAQTVAAADPVAGDSAWVELVSAGVQLVRGECRDIFCSTIAHGHEHTIELPANARVFVPGAAGRAGAPVSAESQPGVAKNDGCTCEFLGIGKPPYDAACRVHGHS